jgi:DNA-binding beta-propeller fold protein YncE
MTTQVMPITFQHSHTIGRREVTGGGHGFSNPSAVARGEGDRLYIVNRALEIPEVALHKQITICTVGEEYITEFGRGVPSEDADESAPDGTFMWPSSLAFDAEWNIYVTDEWINRVSIFTKDGEWISKWGTGGDGDGEMSRPSGIALDKDDNVYVVDAMNNRIQVFTKHGKFLQKWGRAGTGDGEFNMPWGIDIDKNGDVYVADWRNDRIQKFTPDGQFLRKFGVSGGGEGELNRPTGIAVDKDGLIYVADWKNDRIQVFDEDGFFLAQLTGDATISKWGQAVLDSNPEMWQGREQAQDLEREKPFYGPIAVEVDDENRVLVVDSGRSRVQVYRKQTPIFYGGRL